jgi:threonine synthase
VTLEYECVSCGRRLKIATAVYECPHCSPGEGFRKGNLIVVQPEGIIGRPGEKASISEMLPYDPARIPAFPAGGTPLSHPRRLSSRYGVERLYFKNDHLNPSGSLKDRASLLVALQALELGEKSITVASTGNAGSAMACAGAAAGLDIILFVPETAPRAKLLQSILYGARVVPVRGTYDDAFKLSIEYSKAFGGINRNTAYNPLTVEGKKSVALEIYNQLEGRSPDTVYVPVGDGVIFSSVYKGFADLKKAGYLNSLPELILVQAEGSNAISRSYREGTEHLLSSSNTFADSIAVASPSSGELAIQALNATGGRAIDVSDDAIRTAQLELCTEAGTFVEPSSAAAWAGFLADKASLDPERVAVVILTGTGFKDLREAETLATVPSSCEAEIGAVMEYLSTYSK